MKREGKAVILPDHRLHVLKVCVFKTWYWMRIFFLTVGFRTKWYEDLGRDPIEHWIYPVAPFLASHVSPI
jgi:hypothetical protein